MLLISVLIWCWFYLGLPRFDEQPYDITVYPGQTAYFPCSIQGHPPAEIAWLKDDRAIRIDIDERMTLLPSGALEIRRVQTSDSGTYKCNASNAERHRISSTGTLTVSLDYCEYLFFFLMLTLYWWFFKPLRKKNIWHYSIVQSTKYGVVVRTRKTVIGKKVHIVLDMYNIWELFEKLIIK